VGAPNWLAERRKSWRRIRPSHAGAGGHGQGGVSKDSKYSSVLRALARLSVDGVCSHESACPMSGAKLPSPGAPPGPSWCLPIWSACAGRKGCAARFSTLENYARPRAGVRPARGAGAFVEFVLSSGAERQRNEVRLERPGLRGSTT